MNNCAICGYPIMPPGVPYGYVGPVCHGHTFGPQYAPMPPREDGCRPLKHLSEDDVRRIVREELGKSDPFADAPLTGPGSRHEAQMQEIRAKATHETIERHIRWPSDETKGGR